MQSHKIPTNECECDTEYLLLYNTQPPLRIRYGFLHFVVAQSVHQTRMRRLARRANHYSGSRATLASEANPEEEWLVPPTCKQNNFLDFLYRDLDNRGQQTL